MSLAFILSPFILFSHVLKPSYKFWQCTIWFGALILLIASTNQRFNKLFGEYCIINYNEGSVQRESVERVSRFFANWTITFWIILPIQAAGAYTVDILHIKSELEVPVRKNTPGYGLVPPSPRYNGSLRPPPDGNPRRAGLAYPPGTPRNEMSESGVVSY